MSTNQRLPWGALLVATGILAGCGGGSGGDGDTPLQTITGPTRPSGFISPNVTITVGADAARPTAPEDFHRHQMNGFRAWRLDYANASLKLLISAIGPKPLLDHLENFRKTARTPEESGAAAQFIDLIHKAYTADASVDTEAFILGLQELAPFNKRNAAGDSEFKLRSDFPFTQQDPERFLPLISQLFRLDTLPGWSFDIDETHIHQGQERAQRSARNSFQMFQPVQLNRVKSEDLKAFKLQTLVDLLHADQEALVKWNDADAQATAVKVRRQVSIPDVENFKRLTIWLQGQTSENTSYSLNDTATLPAIDQKTKQKIVLTLAAKEAVMWSGTRYVIRIKDDEGWWIKHDDSFVSPAGAGDDKHAATLINFAVTNVAPAP
ncbi:hypothetical protein [Comamonas endophytica]|uniref:Beta-barrel assembly machine subunit BamC n=1 Tax=Comamonas endophytica TaxID=2949090 RepID=A0ABY6GFD7_9BURK|nr:MULTISPECIES: hypothetical protein [unclassified Acidovorax]MCD2514435.1 hypothetical protein [Acidovorax sp. D4N7]UYG53724.1 hypothetical protein M9799_17465 [Acidovorax sp. 5MLIR]